MTTAAPSVERRLLQGSEAIAEAMIAAGCRFFAGYPMTPFTEVLEHMAKRLPGVGGTCINAESELEAVGMAWGAAATGTRSATGSVGQGLSLMQESLSEICFARVPLVVINMARGQGDYFQATRGGGHGDYRHIVLAPSDIPEAVYLTQLSFHLADYWRNPVFLFGDYYLAHVAEAVDTSAVEFGALPSKDWALDGSSGGTGHAKIVSPLRDSKRSEGSQLQYGQHLMKAGAHIAEMAAGVEPMVELGFTDDAELIVVAYGTPGRYVRYTVARLREEGLRVGFVRPITLWPFPTEALVSAIGPQTRAVAVYELNAGQMIEDVRLAVLGRVPVSAIGGSSFDASAFGIAPDLEVDIVAGRIRESLHSISKESV
jgi:2-oxoglutarate/2-oxoacid ferredoxin oxidoreductase subunit alpha